MPEWIDWLRYLFLGLLQGLAEVLPISSSGHLVLAQDVLQMGQADLAFEVFLHLASLLAILLLFGPTLWRVICGFFRYGARRELADRATFVYGWYLILATVVTIIVAFMIKYLTGGVFAPLFVGVCLFLNGGMLLWLGNRSGTKPMVALRWWQVALIGLFQGIGVFPGISRSGATISGALLQGVERKEAVDFAFLLFVPAAAGAAILELPNFFVTLDGAWLGPYLIGFGAALLATYFAFAWLRRLIQTHRFHYFGYYCVVVGLITIVLSR